MIRGEVRHGAISSYGSFGFVNKLFTGQQKLTPLSSPNSSSLCRDVEIENRLHCSDMTVLPYRAIRGISSALLPCPCCCMCPMSFFYVALNVPYTNETLSCLMSHIRYGDIAWCNSMKTKLDATASIVIFAVKWKLVMTGRAIRLE